MNEFKIIIPEERYQIINFTKEDVPGVAVINSSLKLFEPKAAFDWHLSLIIDCKDLMNNGMPSKREVKTLDQIGGFLDDNIKGPNKSKPNALFLCRITWNKTRQLIWRVFEPREANELLQSIIINNSFKREFDYCMEHDEYWEYAINYLNY